MLPNGSRSLIRIRPAPASAAELNRLRAVIMSGSRQQTASLRKNSKAIATLAKKLTADTKRLSTAQLRSQRKLEARRIAGDAKLRKKLALRMIRRSGAMARQRDAQALNLARLRRRQLWDSVVVTTSAPLFAAYGQRSRPFSENNLVLTLSLAIWLLGDEVTDTLSGRRRSPARALDMWSYFAPVGNLFTGWWLLNDRQHSRFATGTLDTFTELTITPDPLEIGEDVEVGPVVGPAAPGGPPMATYSSSGAIDLGAFMSDAHIDDFANFSNVPAVAVPTGNDWQAVLAEQGLRVTGISARVEGRALIVEVQARGPAPDPDGEQPISLPPTPVMWMVDTQDPSLS